MIFCNECVSRNCINYCRRNRILRDSKGNIHVDLEWEDGFLFYTIEYTYNGEEKTRKTQLCEVTKQMQWREVQTLLDQTIAYIGKQLAAGRLM